MRLISDELFKDLVKILTEDEKVKAFQQLILAPKADQGDKPDEVKEHKENE